MSLASKALKLENCARRALFHPFNLSWPRPSPRLDSSRRSWQSLAQFLIEKVLEANYDERRGYFFRSLSFDLQRSSAGAASDRMEFIARSFIGAGYLLSCDENRHLQDRYRLLIEKGTDPSSDFFWGRIASDQIVVENTSLIIGLLLNERRLWNTFESGLKHRVTDYIHCSLRRHFSPSNWLWFEIFHHLFLDQLGGSDEHVHITHIYERLNNLYVGAGWYNDSIDPAERRLDHYNAWAMHYYGLLFCLLAKSPSYETMKQELRARYREFHPNLLSFLTENGLPLMWGRSALYRFAILAPLGLAIASGLVDPKSYGLINRLATNTVNQFLSRGALDSKGLLALGYTGANPFILEQYSGPGSPYWALKAFSFLLLEPGHPFWSSDSDADTSHQNSAEVVIPSIGVSVRNSVDGHVRLLNGGFNSRLYPAAYNKFCYSNICPPVTGGRYQDHQFAFFDARGCHRKDTLVHTACARGSFHVEWGIEAIPSFKAYSTIIPFETGYLLVSHFSGAGKRRMLFCGFNVPDYLKLKPGGFESKVSVFGDLEFKAGLRRVASKFVLTGGKSTLPIIELKAPDDGTPLAFLVEAGPRDLLGQYKVIFSDASISLDGGFRKIVLTRRGNFYEPKP